MVISEFKLNAHLKAKTATVVLLSILFSACSALKTPQRTGLVPLKDAQIIGRYPVAIHIENALKLPSNVILWNHFLKHANADSVEVKQANYFQLALTDEKTMTANLYKDDRLLKTHVLKGRLKDGYFRLKHRLKLSGVPLIFWGLNSEKTQFGIGSNQELYIDASSTRNGGFLFFLAGTPDITTSTTVPQYHP